MLLLLLLLLQNDDVNEFYDPLPVLWAELHSQGKKKKMKRTKKKVNARLRTGSRPCWRGESPSTSWKEDPKRSFADGSRHPQEKRSSCRQHNRDWMISVQHFLFAVVVDDLGASKSWTFSSTKFVALFPQILSKKKTLPCALTYNHNYGSKALIHC
jgi:hypothetical protein